MGFYIAQSYTNGLMNSGTIELLSPGPTYVDYPPRYAHNVLISVDGSAVIQAPLADGRTRSWVWERYRIATPGYLALFNKLHNLQYKLRISASQSPYVYLKEDVTDNLAKLSWDGDSWEHVNDWVRVKVTNVTQDVASQGGPVVYGATRMEFVIDDSSWNAY